MAVAVVAVAATAVTEVFRVEAFSPIVSSHSRMLHRSARAKSSLFMSGAAGAMPLPSGTDDGAGAVPTPTTFREAEVMGLKLMQEGEHEEALKAFKTAMNLPGSRPDVVRTRTLSGPSPVGGSAGGTEGKLVMSLDEFEMQAAHYNIACAYARLRNVPESVANLKVAFDCGFDNYATVRSDPDLSEVHGTAEFEALMDRYDKKGLFGFFGKK